MNKIEKLELKNLCGYLPYGLKVQTTVNIEGNPVIDEMTLEYLKDMVDNPIGEKPLLLPLSALTEPLEDGTVPIVELAKMSGFTPSTYTIEDQNGTIVIYGEKFSHPEVDLFARFFFEIDLDSCNMDKGIEYEISELDTVFTPLPKQLESIEYLYSKHFDIYSLIDAGLAIDKRTVKI